MVYFDQMFRKYCALRAWGFFWVLTPAALTSVREDYALLADRVKQVRLDLVTNPTGVLGDANAERQSNPEAAEAAGVRDDDCGLNRHWARVMLQDHREVFLDEGCKSLVSLDAVLAAKERVILRD